MLLTVSSIEVLPATKKDAARISITGQNLEEILYKSENIREDFVPTSYTAVFHTENRREMNYLWKAIKKMSGISLINKLDACVGNELYLNSSFLQQA